MPRRKLDSSQFVPSIAPQMFVLLLDLADELGVSPHHLCNGLGHSADELRTGEPISSLQAWRMIRRALWLTGRADLGLEIGIRQNFSHFGLPGFAMNFARTLGDALQIGLRFQNQSGATVRAGLQYCGEYVSMTVDSNFRDATVLPFVIEASFARSLAIAKLVVGDLYRPYRLELSYPEPAHAERYHELFGCPVAFGRPRNRALIDRRWMSWPIATHSTEGLAQMMQMLERQAETRSRVLCATVAVEQFLLQRDNAKLSIHQVADALQISVRTLRRRLDEDGTSFRTLSERIRVETAQSLLCEQGLTVRATAERLSFSDARAFRRAYKRWVGRAPGEMRRARNP